MNLANVMQEVADRLATISGLRTYGYPADKPEAPAAVVDYPETITFDETYGRGMDRMTLPVVVLVGKVSDRAARANLGKYVNGSGASSVKQILESGTYTAFETLRVTRVEFDILTVAGTDYLAATFIVDIAGQGA